MRGIHTQSSPEAKTTECGTHLAPEQTGRPKDDTKTPRGRARKNAQEPNCSNSFIWDQIVRSRPDRGDPILKEYRPDIQSRLCYDRVGENTLDPQGDPIAKQLRIDERKQPLFRSSAQKNATQPDTGDPIAKAQHQPLGKELEESSFRSRSETNLTRQGDLIAKTPTKHQEGGGRDFVPMEDWDRLDPEGWPHREDLTRNRSREPEGTKLHNARSRANGQSRGTQPWANQLAR